MKDDNYNVDIDIQKH